MIAAARLLLPLALFVSSAAAFAPAYPSRRLAIDGRAASVACADTTAPTVASRRALPLFEQPPLQEASQSVASSTTTEPDVMHDITTLVGKTASTLVSVSFFFLLAYRRDAIVLTLWVGSILNAILSKVAKKLLNHERPQELQNSDKVKLKPSDGGMPSSHAMSLGFIGTSILGGIVPAEYRLGAGLAMAGYAAMALRYRVRDHLHTSEQVAVGLVLGVGTALAWLKLGMGNADAAGPVLAWVRNNFVSAETDLFPYSALAVPIVVGILVVGSFERRIALWLKDRKAD